MSLVNTVNYYANIVMFATVLIVAIIAALLYYFVKVRKITASEEKIHYDNFNRKSSMEYCKFDDIVSDDGTGLSGAGMIVVNDNTFVTGIDIIGYNFSHASAGEKERTMINAISFANIIEEPIQMRQTVKSVDMQHNIDMYVAAREEEAKKLVELSQQYDELVIQGDANKNDPDVMEIIINKLNTLAAAIDACEWRIQEADEIILYERELMNVAGRKTLTRANQMLFSYKYNAAEMTEELTREEIYIKAMSNLNSKINIYSAALSNCGCSCKPLSATDLTELIRKHMHPITGEMVDINDLISTELDELFVTSNSIFDLEKERIENQTYENFLKENHLKPSKMTLEKELELKNLQESNYNQMMDELNQELNEQMLEAEQKLEKEAENINIMLDDYADTLIEEGDVE